MTTADPISLAQAQRLAASADTILLRATRPADLETPIGAFLRLDDGGPAYLLESVEGGERLGRYSFLGVGPRRILEVRDGAARTQTRPVTEPTYSSDLPIETAAAADPLAAIRAFVPRRRVQPTEGMPRFTGGAVGALAYDAISAFEPSVPLPERDPVGVPTATFIETDLVLVFDHLTHELSAIASLHTETPRIEERYRIAERALFEALEQTARPSVAEIAGAAALRAAASAPPRQVQPRRAAPPGRPPQARRRPRRTCRSRAWAGTRSRPRSGPPRTRSRPARRSRWCSHGERPGRCRPAPTGAPSTGSAFTARSAESTPARTCSSSGRPRSRWWAPARSCSSRWRATG